MILTKILKLHDLKLNNYLRLFYFSLYQPLYIKQDYIQVYQILRRVTLYKGTNLWKYNSSEQVLLNFGVHNCMLIP